MIRPLLDPADLRAALDADAVEALDAMTAEVAADPSRLDRTFPAAARRTARGPLPGRPELLVEDAVRVELLAAAAGTAGAALLDELRALYRFGDSDEKRAVLLGLSAWDDDTVDGSDLLADALRTNDTRLVAAAMGPHASRLDDDAWRHGVLKCLFTGVPVSAVSALSERADDELAAMARRYAREREAAGREVPADLDLVLAAADTSAHPTAGPSARPTASPTTRPEA